MNSRRILDTNLIIRHLVQDHPKHATAAGILFAACDRGEFALVVLPAVLAECVFVLESFYKQPRHGIAQTLGMLIGSPGIEISDKSVHRDALDRYRASSAHFVDCLIAAHATAENISVATFDEDFKKFPDVRVEIGVT